MLAGALQRLDETGGEHDRVYAFENGISKSRQFHIMTPEQAWGLTCKSKHAHIYEVLSGPCNLYLDIEWYVSNPPPDEKDRVQQIVAHVQNVVQTQYTKARHITTTLASASGYANGKYKCSWHVHMACEGICWANAAAVGQFVRSSCSTISEVDKVPYAGQGQNWRCVGSSKATEPERRFQPVDRDTFFGCTVQQPVAGRSIIYPVVDVPCRIDIPVPSYVQVLVDSLRAGGTPVMMGSERCVVPFKELQICEHVGRKHRSNHQYAVINTGTLMWKMNCHSCTQAISAWRTFDATVLQHAFTLQRESYQANCSRPAVLNSAAVPDTLDMLCHGPPPPRAGRVVRCIDGIYALSECQLPPEITSLSKTSDG